MEDDDKDIEWLNETELRIRNKVCHITNPEWIKNLFKLLENKEGEKHIDK